MTVLRLKTNALNKIKLLIPIFALSCLTSYAQMITGVWKGKINRQKAELKIVQNGDSLTGTSYYYDSPDSYRRYSIKGYYDVNTNEAVWWDDKLMEQSGSAPGRIPMLARADFNCPGDGRMMLDGKAGRPTDEDPKGDLHLDKIETSSFPDEWNFVIDNYLIGANDPWIIDSITALADIKPVAPVRERRREVVKTAPPVKQEEKAIVPFKPTAPPPTIEEKFIARQKKFVAEIPVTGDSIELRFYDNAEIDGDSISLFLNDKLIFQHIRLLASAYTIKLDVSQLQDSNELIMVAENLGSIPPNTSFMVALVNDKRYEARLESTEGSSAMIRFIKKPISPSQ